MRLSHSNKTKLLAGKIIPLLPEEILLNPKDFTHVIYVAAHDFGSFEGKDSILKYFLGVVDIKHNYSTSIGSSSGLSFFRQQKFLAHTTSCMNSTSEV